ncbi:MAG TPA: uracil-DNA glycosylase [Longimicrobium sp.]
MELDRIPPSWRPALAAEVEQPYFAELRRFVEDERRTQTVFPSEDEVFSQLELTPYDRVKVLILGQDPYHGPRQAHGLAFSVRPGVRPPPSLANIFKELHDDRGCPIPKHGYLASWAEQGVLLLNAVLTVRRREPNSHKNRGWERFTDAIIRAVNERDNTVAFVLWGAYAGKKEELIDGSRHAVIRSVHPSPYSADKGFFGSKPFSQVNEALERSGQEPVDWCLPETVEGG